MSITKNILIAIFLLFTIALTESNFLPLELGNKWTYRVVNRDLTGIIDSTLVSVIQDKNDSTFEFSEFFCGSKTKFSLKISCDADIIFYYDRGNKYPLYNFNIEIGDSFLVPFYNKVGESDHVITKLISKNDQFIIGNDTLKNCYTFNSYSLNCQDCGCWSWKDTFSKDVGFVKRAVWSAWHTTDYFLKNAIVSGIEIPDSTTSVSQITNTEILDSFTLYQNYPNPFNPSTMIEFTLNKDQYISLKIYNVLGHEIETLVSEFLPKGNYSFQWIPTVSSNFYYYSLLSEHDHVTKKMQYLK